MKQFPVYFFVAITIFCACKGDMKVLPTVNKDSTTTNKTDNTKVDKTKTDNPQITQPSITELSRTRSELIKGKWHIVDIYEIESNEHYTENEKEDEMEFKNGNVITQEHGEIDADPYHITADGRNLVQLRTIGGQTFHDTMRIEDLTSDILVLFNGRDRFTLRPLR